MSLHKQFTLLFASIALLSIGFFSWQDYRSHKSQINAGRQGKVDLLTEIINNGLTSLMLEGRGKEFQKFLDNLIAEDIVAIRIFNQEGIILNSTVPGEIGRRVPDKDMSVCSMQKDFSVFMSDYKGKKVFSKIVLIKNDQICHKCHGSNDHNRGVLDVEFSASDTDWKVVDAAGVITRRALLLLLVLVGSVGLLSFYLIKAPLDRIIESAQKIARGNLREKIQTTRQDEIGLLASNLNEIIADIDRKMAEIETCRADRDLRMEKMASLGELAAAVAHEIKNPLAGISGALQVLAEDFPDDSPRKEISKEILEEIERLDRSVRDLLLFARPPEMNLIPVDINAIIEKVAGSVSPLAAKLNVRITMIPDNIATVMVDPDQMEKAMANIALYSLQSMQKGGQLIIAVKEKQAFGTVEIALSDTGEDIPEENLKDIFKPFFSTKNSGSGLGLAIARNIIESHKGTISVESRTGTGTTYRIIIPKMR